MRTFVFGDIHGGLKALDQVIAKLDLVTEDKLIFLGDYVDGWSESAQVIDRLIELDKQYECVFIKGNHDQMCEDWLMGERMDPSWRQHGGAETVDSYQFYFQQDRVKHIRFFKSMRRYVVDEENRLFVHAGFTSMKGPKAEIYKTNFFWDRTLWETVKAMDTKMEINDPFYPKRLKLFREIYIGHTALTDYGILIPVNKANLWNMDTGAAFTGKLSCMEINTKELFQSDKLIELYPDEKGRNK